MTPHLDRKTTRVVKTCLWFRKNHFWSQYGPSKYAGNFAETAFQIAQIVDIQIFCYQNKGPVECQIMYLLPVFSSKVEIRADPDIKPFFFSLLLIALLSQHVFCLTPQVKKLQSLFLLQCSLHSCQDFPSLSPTSSPGQSVSLSKMHPPEMKKMKNLRDMPKQQVGRVFQTKIAWTNIFKVGRPDMDMHTNKSDNKKKLAEAEVVPSSSLVSVRFRFR